MMTNAAMRAGFSGGLVVDYPHRWVPPCGSLLTLRAIHLAIRFLAAVDQEPLPAWWPRVLAWRTGRLMPLGRLCRADRRQPGFVSGSQKPLRFYNTQPFGLAVLVNAQTWGAERVDAHARACSCGRK